MFFLANFGRLSISKLLVFCLLLQGCSMLEKREAIPEQSYGESLVLGLPDLRSWGDETIPIGKDLPPDPSIEELQVALPGFVGREWNMLAISGGGSNGAFAAGLLNGWSAAGGRPEFTVVTGISTGALAAPFAFLGQHYDQVLEQIYTSYSTDDLVRKQGWYRYLLGTEASYDTSALRQRIATYVDEAVMSAIAAEYGRGRLLLIGTTNLDAARPVVWNIGAIASSGAAGALDLIHDVILASASIPVAFPPVLISVESQGRVYDEMHVDGGVSRQSFLFHLSSPEDTFQRLNIVGQGRAYLIRNSKLRMDWNTVDRSMLSIAGRSASAMVHKLGLGDLYREFLGAQKFNFDFNLAYIPSSFDAEAEELFDQNYMRRLYVYAYEKAANGYPWEKKPPALGQP
jgi:predicted acylesterase/phospholipase RssA